MAKKYADVKKELDDFIGEIGTIWLFQICSVDVAYLRTFSFLDDPLLLSKRGGLCGVEKITMFEVAGIITLGGAVS